MHKKLAALVAAAIAISSIAFAGSASASTAPTPTITAHTAVSSNQHTGSRVAIAPPAPLGAKSKSASVAPLALHSPSVSPAVNTSWVAPGAYYTCYYGDLCTLVWDPTMGEWKLFHLYDCNAYALAYWQGTGYYWDRQTPGTISYFDTNWTINVIGPPDYQVHSYNWDPIQKIINC